MRQPAAQPLPVHAARGRSSAAIAAVYSLTRYIRCSRRAVVSASPQTGISLRDISAEIRFSPKGQPPAVSLPVGAPTEIIFEECELCHSGGEFQMVGISTCKLRYLPQATEEGYGARPYCACRKRVSRPSSGTSSPVR